ncbi:MAG: hypothetical protein V4501_11380 [Pseudomonadota bacterium]
MSCDICGEGFWGGKQHLKFGYAQLFYGYEILEAHLECAMIFNAMNEAQRKLYVENVLKEPSDGFQANACDAIASDTDE